MSYCEDLCEKSLRLIFEDGITIFRNHRPYWLKNPSTGKNLELDFYLPHAQLAIEIQGEHHYTNPDQIARDLIKRHILDGFSVTLLDISITQIAPSQLWERILHRAPFIWEHMRMRRFDPAWTKIPEVTAYKKRIAAAYSDSKCVVSPQLNRSKTMSRMRREAADSKIMLCEQFTHRLRGENVRVTPIEISSKTSVLCRVLGTSEMVHLRKGVALRQI
jgi:hypothetical protein